MKEYTEDTKSEIINMILKEVNEKGSSRVGYHAQQVLGKDKIIPYNIKSKIEGTIVATRKYVSRSHPNFKNDFEILDKQLVDFSKMKWQRNLAVVVAILSLLANIVLIIVEIFGKKDS